MKNDDYCDDCPNPAGCYATGRCQMPGVTEQAEDRLPPTPGSPLPCPFCGRDPKPIRECGVPDWEGYWMGGKFTKWTSVGCFVSQDKGCGVSRSAPTEAEAWVLWNTRV